MRLLKIPLLLLMLFITLSGTQSAQGYVRCNNIDESTVDLVRLNLFEGRPGDTVWAPFYLESDSSVTGFKMLIRFDDTYLTPVFYEDPLLAGLIVSTLVGRFVQTEEKVDQQTGQPYLDTITDFQAQFSANPFDSGAILTTFNINFPEDSAMGASIDPGTGIIYKLAFEVSPSMPHGTFADFDFHEVNEWYVDTTGGIPTQVFLDCRRTDLAVAMNDGTVTSYPKLISNYFHADTGYVEDTQPVIGFFQASLTNIEAGGSSTLSWSVSNATGASISNIGTVSLSGSQAVSPTTTTTYYLTAVNGSNTASSSVTVTVGGGGDNNAPVISLTPNQNSYSIEQGETVSFTVGAVDVDGDVITLSATALPNNAIFNTVVGSGTVQGGFSFTPDVSQQGSYAAVFSASDDQGGTSTPVAVSITVNEILFDRLITTSSIGRSPIGGIAGNPAVYLPINLISSQTVYGIQYDFFYDYSLFGVDSVVTSVRTPEYVVYDNIGGVPGEVRVVAFGLANEPVLVDDTTTAVLYMVMSIDPVATPGDYPVYIEEGWESVDPNPDIPSLPLVTDSGIIQVDTPGDVNLDKLINVADLVNVVAYVIGNYGFSPRQFDVADVVINDTVNVFDLVAIVNHIFGIPFSPAPAQSYEGGFAKVSLDYGDTPGGSSDLLIVRSELPVAVAGAELEISYDPSVLRLEAPRPTIDAEQMALRYRDDGNGKMKVLMYYTNPFDAKNLIASGTVELVEIPLKAKANVTAGNKSQLRLSKALLSTSTSESIVVEGVDTVLPSSFQLSHNYPNPFNPSTVIEFSLTTTAKVKLNIYNILGQNVKSLINETMPAGAHQVVWDATNGEGQRIATGVYLYKLQVNDKSDTKKMMFLK